MAHLHKKMKKGRPYYYIREMARVDGKPKVVNQIYLGSVERMMQMLQGAPGQPLRISAQEFGALWLAEQIDRRIDFAGIVDGVIPRKAREQGPSVGEYFLYAVFNRMVDACSKRALPDWYRSTAIQHIRPVDIDALDSQGYWKKWERASARDIERIAALFFEKISRLEEIHADCFMFDTTNYYTYMASDTESELAKRGKNKEGKDWLRQIGVALLVSRNGGVPLFYREYEGNRHDSKLFERIIGEVLESMKCLTAAEGQLTIVFDKGMNSEENIAFIDADPRVHFITSYSPYFADALIRVKLAEFAPVDTMKNRKLKQLGRDDDQLVAWRAQAELWGRRRTVIVTFNPLTAAKQRYNFDQKLLRIQQVLSEMRAKVATQNPRWANSKWVDKNYREACEALYVPADLYDVAVERTGERWKLASRKNHYRIARHLERFGKNIIVTDHMDWTTDEIVTASLDRYLVEKEFRQSKDDDLVGVLPLRHWTDSKIRCHVLTCVVALAYTRLLELHLRRQGVSITAATAMREMHRLHSCLCWSNRATKPDRVIEDPNPVQAEILRAFDHEVSSGVLQKIRS